MQTAEVANHLMGNKLYQKRARKALPVLVRQAWSGEKIFYADLAEELGMANPRNLNFVLGCVGNTLLSLSRRWNEEIPPIQCLVVNQQSKLPGEGIGWFFDNGAVSGFSREKFARLKIHEKRRVVEAELSQVFGYQRWEELLAELGLGLPESTLGGFEVKPSLIGSGESEAHRILKEFIANNPRSVGLSGKWDVGEIEKRLLSGDFLDVSFDQGNKWLAVEVKSALSNDDDLVRGLFQCVKYRAVIEASCKANNLEKEVSSVLALEGSMPKN